MIGSPESKAPPLQSAVLGAAHKLIELGWKLWSAMKLVSLLNEGDTTEATPSGETNPGFGFDRLGAGQGWRARRPWITVFVASFGPRDPSAAVPVGTLATVTTPTGSCCPS